jgi:transcriptional regulator with XRE-family HTH domain
VSKTLINNIKWLRKSRGLTQDDLAKKIDLTRSIVGSYEEGRAEPGLENIQKLAYFFGVTIDELLSRDLSKKGSKSYAVKDIEGLGLRILPVIVDNEDQNEFISVVPIKAAAGYAQGYTDPEFVEEMPKFRLPLPQVQNRGSLRVFQIKGESMLPVPAGAWIIGEYLENWRQIRDGQCYVFILNDQDNIVYKRAYNKIEDAGEVLLKSDNLTYNSYPVKTDEILEVWKAIGYISFEIPEPNVNTSIVNLTSMVMELKGELDKIKNEPNSK